MIVGQFTETYPPMVDGVGRVAAAYCETLEKLGNSSFYVAPDSSEKADCGDIKTILYKGLKIPNQPYRLGKAEFTSSYRRAVKNTDFDVIHAHTPFFAGAAARKIAKKRNLPLIATFHSKYKFDVWESTHSRFLTWLVGKIVVNFCNKCDEVWTVCEGTKKVLEEYGFTGKIVVMPNGTDPYEISKETIEENLKPLNIRENVPVLLFVGQVDHKKGIDKVIEAAAILKSEGMDFELLIAGDGQDKNKLVKRSKELNLEKQVHFLGFINNNDKLYSLYDRADLFVFPSVYDNAPMCVREAAIMETPALLVRGSCSAEVVEDGVNGFLCEDNIESIAEGIKAALPKVKEAGIEAKKTIPLPWEEILKRVCKRYEDLIKAHKQGVEA